MIHYNSLDTALLALTALRTVHWIYGLIKHDDDLAILLTVG